MTDRSTHPPLPPRLDPRAGAQYSGDERRPRRRGTAVVRALAAIVSVVVLGTGGWGWYLSRVAEASVNRTDAIPDSGNGTGHGGAEMNLLLVGDDSRDDLSTAQMKLLNAGADGGSLNTDTMMLLHVPADGSQASFVSFPRDSYVQIPGHGWDKLNAAYADGYVSAPKSQPESTRQAAGQQLLVQTISQLTGLTIDHYVSVDLLGFYNLSSVVGGVQVNLCAPVEDHYSGAHFPAGVQTISGADALKFVRQRHGLPRGDLDRIVRQQVFIAGVVRKMISDNVLLNPAKQQQLVQSAAKSLTVDQSLNLLQLAQQMQSVTAGGVNFQTMPIAGDAQDPQGRDILKLPGTTTLHAFFGALGSTGSTAAAAPATGTTTPAAPRTVTPGAVKVQVFNGSGITGLAAKAASELTTAGFPVAGTGNADASSYATTQIRFAAGDDALAATLAAKIPGATTVQQTGVTSGTVQLVLGKNFTAVGQPVAAAATSSAAAAPTQTPRNAADTGCIN